MQKNISADEFKNKLVPFLSGLFLFKNFSKETLLKIYEQYDFQIMEFESGDKIYTPSEFFKKVGFVFSGECIVEKERSDGNSVPLNVLLKNDSFGILAVFSKTEKFPTSVKAKKRSIIVFLDESALLSLIKEYSEVALAVIEFMSNRIEFLNEKIATFSADSVEEKLACYILQESKSTGSEVITINLSKTAKILNAGRASIYRAIEALKKMEIINFDNKKIYIKDVKSLERITQ